MYGEEAKVPFDIVVGRPPQSETPVVYAMKQAKKLEQAYQDAREELAASQKIMKTRYDLGAINRIFRVGDKVRIRLKNLAFKPASKLKAPWSEVCEVLEVQGVIVTIKILLPIK